MSTALAISGVTAILQFYLNNVYGTAVGFSSPVSVSCKAPDQVKIGAAGSADVENQVNLFLHQVTHNAAWRNSDLPSMGSNGSTRLKNPPLALNLHYLLTAYGSDDWQAEALLGYALMMLHEAPMLTRSDVSNALKTLTGPPQVYPLNPLSPYLAGTGLADQIEMIKIVPETLGREEMAWLWTALKADYRPTFPFQVSVVLMQPSLPATQALPVLRASFAPQPMQTARIDGVQYAAHQSAALPGDPVTVTGANLFGATRASITNQRYGIQLLPLVTQALGDSVAFTLPTELMQPFPAGVYQLTVQFLDTSGTVVQQTTNSIPFAVSPTLPTQTATTAAVPPTSLIAVTVNGITPDVYEGQSVSLALSTTAAPVVSKSAQAQPFTGNVSSLTFQFDAGLPVAVQLLGRLQVDGVTSQVQVTWSPFPPTFSGPWVTL
jgi:hypothetical protein